MADNVSYGWMGWIARVNLSTGEITEESDEAMQKDYIGGMGFANKIMYDEVPAGVDWMDEENKVVLAVGPLTGAGVPLGGRSTWATLSTFTTDHLVVDSHCGGQLGAKLKYSGHDGLIIEGKADKPVYILIDDDDISIEDASALWGKGTRETNEALCKKHGVDVCVAAIGPAGENLLPYACVLNTRSHSAGAGLGAVLGAKNVKAVVVRGTKGVNVADPQMVADLSDYMIDQVIGSNNNHVVPSTQQSWAEYYDKGSRWTAKKGLYWAAAEGGAIETGEPKPHEPNTMGYRCMKSTKDLGPEAEKYTVKMAGCHGCPVRCYSQVKHPQILEKTGYESMGNTCVPNFPFSSYMQSMMKVPGTTTEDGALTEQSVLYNLLIQAVVDDLGLWCNYAQLYRDLAHTYVDGILERELGDQFAEYGFDKIMAGDPTPFIKILSDIASNDTENKPIAWLGHGPLVWTEKWNDAKWYDDSRSCLINYRGWPVHHAIECFGQVGGLYNMVFNRDDMIHSAVNFQGCGLPIDLKKEMGAEMWGEGAVDADKNYTPMNEAKAEFAWWSIVTDVLHDCLTLCNWVWPMAMAPDKDRSYRGDLDLEAQFYTAVTGQEVTIDDLYKAGERVMTLQRCNTARGMLDKDGNMGCNDFRGVHDVMTDWPFTKDPDIEPFTAGTDKMEREDWDSALTMLYKRFGWDEKLGCPTKECLEDLGLTDQEAELEELGLLTEGGAAYDERTRTYDHVLEKYCGDNPALNA
ncbi:aldehyde ferredoxin oxidoreductase [Collinsella ihumii]|uniref:aldehyde ferredoxin oxidoreductase n=1 Tax=Collinsella ihumii TaxID=1720204 RepID=UPI00082DC9D6|nr:aldehyde ferredoxin oxidoreductase [Collinsella ihumii]MBM6687736.1 aldehyde ferredoxin oxidoreductase [Collinsella tanakaei]